MPLKFRQDGQWVDIASSNASSNVVVNQDNYGCLNPITTNANTISIGTTSNAYGTRYVEDHLPLSSDGCDGDLWYYTADTSGTFSSSNITLGTPQSTTSGTQVVFTGIPSWAKRITIMFNLVSLSGSDNLQVELGTSSAYITSGYTATSQKEVNEVYVDSTSAFIIYNDSGAKIHCGKFEIDKFSDTAYTFIGQERIGNGNGLQSYGVLNGVSGTIDRLRITPSGSNTFDGGSINISYE